jgi:hypothetical protein
MLSHCLWTIFARLMSWTCAGRGIKPCYVLTGKLFSYILPSTVPTSWLSRVLWLATSIPRQEVLALL